MRKTKTYEISVIDKTYSKTISDETKFYTSDTALELEFKLKETEYTFESAEIVLLNIDDRSLTTRPVSKVNNDFVYELDDDIIPHYGEWHGQLRFEAGGTYVSSPVKFRIENDLSNERPPQISDVQSWVSLRRYADGLVDELKQAVLSAETFNANEVTRQENESVRQQAESQRQSTFETNETERQTTFETAELTREQAETQRASAESSRVSAEEQRKTDHANRSAELDSKANKEQENWITPTLLNGWTEASGYPVRYMKDEMGFVHLKGAISNATAILPSTALNFPVGYRSNQTVGFPLQANNTSLTISYINNMGAVVIAGAAKSYVFLDNITFRTEG